METDDYPLRQIAILGAGAMGCFVGFCLATTGANITLLDVDAAQIATIRHNGLTMTRDGVSATNALPIMRPEDLSHPPDLLILLTKQHQTNTALAAILPKLRAQCWVLTLQNGLGNRELIQKFVPDEKILLGVTTYPADLLAPGHVASHGPGEVRLMTADGIMRPVVHNLVALFNAAGQTCVADPNLQAAIWAKVAFNAALNSICGVCRCPVGDVAAVPQARQLALDLAAEVVGVARACGVDVTAAAVRATVERALVEHAGHRPSMLQDLDAGRRTEIDAINGAVAAAAARIGHPAPLTRALDALVRLAEAAATEASPSAAEAG